MGHTFLPSDDDREMRPIRSVVTVVLFASSALAVSLALLWPRPTFAEAIADSDRQGEWDDDGSKFGNVVVKGELVAGDVPGGWVLVRSMENKGEETETCTIEERVLRTETMPDARVEPPPYAVLLRGLTVTLQAHEKRTLGIPLATSVGAQITSGLQRRASIEQRRGRAIERNDYGNPVFAQTYFHFQVEYLKPLPPGATAAKNDNGVTRPMTMGMAAQRAGDAGDFAF